VRHTRDSIAQGDATLVTDATTCMHDVKSRLAIELAQVCEVGDIIIIMSYALMDFEEAKTFQPKVVFPDQNTNKLL
jgi:aspartate 1-decarboxylase